ncbi:hypothetical protein Pcinc_028313 [Petrolisthes cinctipes]|uniref:Uncharacterized protein n=1 Tax=Petrolisthes cinctipes TaxID=88211 RepID=A0AAE1F390_PETCI|nr:hypothetical protein Pcinc_028313 [Petrolisthes cinctipes]
MELSQSKSGVKGVKGEPHAGEVEMACRRSLLSVLDKNDIMLLPSDIAKQTPGGGRGGLAVCVKGEVAGRVLGKAGGGAQGVWRVCSDTASKGGLPQARPSQAQYKAFTTLSFQLYDRMIEGLNLI